MAKHKDTGDWCRDELLAAVQLAYRKHVLDDHGVGWGELEQCLLDTLCNAMGADGFTEWLDSQQEPQP